MQKVKVTIVIPEMEIDEEDIHVARENVKDALREMIEDDDAGQAEIEFDFEPVDEDF